MHVGLTNARPDSSERQGRAGKVVDPEEYQNWDEVLVKYNIPLQPDGLQAQTRVKITFWLGLATLLYMT